MAKLATSVVLVVGTTIRYGKSANMTWQSATKTRSKLGAYDRARNALEEVLRG